MKEEEIKKLVSRITDFVNSYSLKSEQFCDAMSQEHRTLQQSFTRLCLKWIEYVADNEYRTDGRNETSHEVCKRMIELYGDFTEDLFRYRGTPSQMLPLI